MPQITRFENNATTARHSDTEQSATTSGAAGRGADAGNTGQSGNPGWSSASDGGGPSAANWRGLAPWLSLWGAVAVIRALSEFAAQWLNTGIVQQTVTWAAAAATLAGLIVWVLRSRSRTLPLSVSLRAVLPLLIALASVALLDYVHAVDAFFAPMLRALVLSVAFVYAGASGWRGMLALGLWLFAAAVVLGVWYLGYAPLVLEGLSGLALLAAAILVRKQTGPDGTGG